ncbi:MAG: beta-ketoacyl-[acyl-carrier-protein] synthase family protein [Candidatus Omnitrophica bacterium]|nr:beta-ketoacyl-[acyl-carrier-protein] synthase family protein [Candidatus Omnitrophota bacterium]
MPVKPVVISSMGAICAAGKTTLEIISTFESYRRNPGLPTIFESSLDFPVFEVKKFSHPPEIMRTLALAYVALDEAISDAGLDGSLKGSRVGICMGTTVASQLNDESWYRRYCIENKIYPEPIDKYFKGNLAEALALRLGILGPALTIVNACSSGADAIGVAMDWLSTGICDIVIAGGADEINHIPYCGFGALSVTSSLPCKPFDKNRNGLNLGEGAGILILETEASAVRRSRKPDLFVSGYGAAADAYHLTAPRPDGSGLAKAIDMAFTQAGLKAQDIAFVNAHGTSTRDNDLAEGRALLRIFGQDLKFLSTKGFTGHTLGAAGALEAIFIALALRHGWIPGNIGFEETDEEIGIAPVMKKTSVGGKAALSTSLAFGGNNAALIVSRC